MAARHHCRAGQCRKVAFFGRQTTRIRVIQRAGRYGNIKPCVRSRYEAAFCAISQINLRFRRAPVGRSGDFLTPSPPAEKGTARQDQAGQACTGDWAGDARN
jgi:hypothetical protein